MTHSVFAPVEDPSLVVKVFQTRGPQSGHEWEALLALSGSGIAPEPLHFGVGDPSVVVMTRAAGSFLPADVLRSDHAQAIGSVHRLVHGTALQSPRPLVHSGVRAAAAVLVPEHSSGGSPITENAPAVVSDAWRAARRWMAAHDTDRLLASEELRFSRGDPNLSNYMWSAGALMLIDWEDCGYNDVVLELADMAEHASTRCLGEGFWIDLADATELTPAECARLPDARRLMACFWLVLIESRHREGLPTTVTLEDQAARTLATLEG